MELESSNLKKCAVGERETTKMVDAFLCVMRYVITGFMYIIFPES